MKKLIDILFLLTILLLNLANSKRIKAGPLIYSKIASCQIPSYYYRGPVFYIKESGKEMRSHKIRIYPNSEQEKLMTQSCGVARFAYNWGLNKWQEMYKANLKPTFYKLKLEFNKEKKTNKDLIWLYNVSKCISEYALMDLSSAFSMFFKKIAKYPRFKKRKHSNGSFSIANDRLWVNGRVCILSKIGKVKLAEELRPQGKIMKGTVSTYAGKWWLSIAVDTSPLKNINKKAIGIDLGLKNQIITSNGDKYDLPDLTKEINKVKKEQRCLSKKQRGSNNKLKQIIKLQRSWLKYTDKKNDWIDKVTTMLSNKYQYICLETLNIKGMMKNRRLSAKFQQVSLYKIIEELKTKASVVQIDRFFSSSKTCSSCGYINNELTLNDRKWVCKKCGKEHDRDINAAVNILVEGMKSIPEAIREFTPVDSAALNMSNVVQLTG